MSITKRVIAVAAVIGLVAVLCSCDAVGSIKNALGAGEGEEVGELASSTNDVVELPLPESEELDFSLESNEGVDLSNTPDYSEQLQEEEEPTYIEKDGYAWLLDPVTFEIADGPFDLVTHERVALGGEVLTPSQEVPTEENEYPNTGIFLEDD